MGNAECGMSGRASLGDRPPISIPHSALRIPHWVGTGGAVKIAVVFDTLHPEWDDAAYKKELEAKVEEAEYEVRSEEHTSELQSRLHLVCRLLLEKKKKNKKCLSVTRSRYN